MLAHLKSFLFHFQVTKYLIYSQSRLRSAVAALDMEFVHLGCQFLARKDPRRFCKGSVTNIFPDLEEKPT